MLPAIASTRFLTFWFVLLPTILPAATYYVGVDGQGFFPDSLTIHQGDEVIWVNADETDFPHTTTSTLPILNADYWNGQLFSQFDSFAKTFNNVGTFDYIDQADIGTGRIIVAAAVAPGITLTAARIESGSMLFDAAGLTPGKFHVLESSTNLIAWTALQTNLALASIETFTNSATAPRKFFRVSEIP